MSHSLSSAETFVTLARLLRPQGRRGELLADILTDFPELLTAPTGVYLLTGATAEPEHDVSRVVVESLWRPSGKNAGRIVIKLPGVDSITDAEKLAGARLVVPSAERPSLSDDTFYIDDLVGCQLLDGDTPVGEVIDVEFAMTPDGRSRLDDAAPLLCVSAPGATDDADPLLVPFVRAQLQSVDTAARRIVMHLPKGLVADDSSQGSV